MSEGIDLKIISNDEPTLHALRYLHDSIANARFGAGFEFDPKKIRSIAVSRRYGA